MQSNDFYMSTFSAFDMSICACMFCSWTCWWGCRRQPGLQTQTVVMSRTVRRRPACEQFDQTITTTHRSTTWSLDCKRLTDDGQVVLVYIAKSQAARLAKPDTCQHLDPSCLQLDRQTDRQTDRQLDTWLMYCSLFVLSLLLFVVRKKTDANNI